MAESMKILITGAEGFLGRHLQLLLHSLGLDFTAVDRSHWSRLSELPQFDTVIHLAGVNRGSEAEVEAGNLELAHDLTNGLRPHPPRQVIYANSIHSGSDTPYGRGKQAAAQCLSQWMEATGGIFTDVRLPNLFGEDGQPFYNSFVATFVEHVVGGTQPTILETEVPLLHVRDAAQSIFEVVGTATAVLCPEGELHSVSEVWERLVAMHVAYRNGVIPPLATKFEVNLFNTLRARMFRDRPTIKLTPHRDERGQFVETMRVCGGASQVSFSTTKPGITRGQHYHLRKIERFVVMAGEGTIRLRHVLDDEVVEVVATGENPVAVDMPTGWAHSITNTGTNTLLTQFWINEFFDSSDADTFAAEV